ncbi:MAG TPA: antitoxin Xre/MbcA/ParS toxin-binding domain-containing protein [Mucilaginibacter sp.]|jgi:putative toxin-antitoxin system antitoxin component (TIGR02293 family)|nr:antitoxin Xre/MbcA/ParS toxin-binding domain-containing protein [Mucilaginibacter sp.]
MRVAEKKPKLNPELNFVHLLGGKSVLTKPIQSEFDLISLSNEGITKASLDALIGHLGISKKAFSENILDASVKTLERKKSTDKLDKRTSSHVIEIAKVADRAFSVFGDEEKVKRWLNAPNRALNNVKPIDLFYIPTGLAMVTTILGRIEEGVYS